MELHELGPVKLFDTAGIDEEGELGEKKRRKSLAALKESDIGVLVIDISRQQRHASSADAMARSLEWERQVLKDADHYGVVPLLLLNLKGCKPGPDTQQLVDAVKGLLDPASSHLSLTLDLHDGAADVPTLVASFLQVGLLLCCVQLTC